MFAIFVELLEAAVLTGHLICVNLAAGGPVVWLILESRHRKGDPPAKKLATVLGLVSVIALLAGAGIGLLIGWLRWSSDYQALLLQTGSRLWFGVAEWAFSFLLVLGCWLSVRGKSVGRGPSWMRSLLLFLACSNLLYHFPVFFTVVDHLRYQDNPTIQLDSQQFRQLLISPGILARSVHVVVASLAVSGVALAWISHRFMLRSLESTSQETTKQNSVSNPLGEFSTENIYRYHRLGLHLAFWPTLSQLIVGFWVLLSLPREIISRLTGQELIATAALIMSLVSVANLIHHLIRGLLRSSDEETVSQKSVTWMALTIWLMTWASLLAYG
jgi:hypothetical protein